jgi:hypothetical protein
MDDEHFEHVFLLAMGALATGLRYMMDARPMEDEPPPGKEHPEPAEKVVAIGAKK